MDVPLLPLPPPRGERGDAARNRRHLLEVTRRWIAEAGVDKVTMDGLAERAGLGKGTVFRRFGSRAGIFKALLDEDETAFQHKVMAGPPPLGPGADPVARLVAYGRARIEYLLDHAAIARAALDNARPIPAGAGTMSPMHIRALLNQARIEVADTESLAVQLTAALEGPILLYLHMPTPDCRTPDPSATLRFTAGWQTLIERLCNPA